MNTNDLTRKLLLLTLDSGFSHEDDCGTTHFIQMKVDSEFKLKSINGRYFLNPVDNYLERIDYDLHQDLIGKVIKLRSPISCASANGAVCKTCYGDLLYETNKELHPGVLSTLLLTNQFTQNLLSSKHMLRIDTEEIDWNEDILDYFEITKQDLIPKQNISFSLSFDKKNFKFDETSSIYLNAFKISSGKREIEIESIARLYPSDYILDKLSDNKLHKFSNKDLVEGCFSFITENKEFSKSLEQIIQVLDTNKHLIDSQNIHVVFNKLVDLLEENNIHINFAHIEILFKRLVRNANDHNELLDFSKEELDKYVILRATSAILKSGSVALGLSFEKVKMQLKDPTTYSLTKSSRIDSFYK